MAAIPKGAQYFLGTSKAYFRIENGVVEVFFKDKGWSPSTFGTELDVFRDIIAKKQFRSVAVTADTVPLSEPVSITETVWVAQYLDNPNEFGGIDPRSGQHPVRVSAFLAYQFLDEQQALDYCKDKKDLLAVARLTLRAEVLP